MKNASTFWVVSVLVIQGIVGLTHAQEDRVQSFEAFTWELRSLRAVLRTKDFSEPGMLLILDERIFKVAPDEDAPNIEMDDKVLDLAKKLVKEIDMVVAENAKQGARAAVVYLAEKVDADDPKKAEKYARRGRVAKLMQDLRNPADGDEENNAGSRLPFLVFVPGPNRKFPYRPVGEHGLTVVMWFQSRLAVLEGIEIAEEEELRARSAKLTVYKFARLLN